MPSVVSGIAKITTWLLRLIQLSIALILLGITGYMTDQFRIFQTALPAAVLVPLLFSTFALFVSFWSLIAVCCLGYHLQLLAAMLDFAILSGFITSVVLLSDNFHVDSSRNWLVLWLVWIRERVGETPRVKRSGALVQALDACVVLMILLFFFTTLLSVLIAQISAERHAQWYRRGRTQDYD